VTTITLGTTGAALRAAVQALPICRHCEGCQGADPTNPDPVHHASIELTGKCNHECMFCYSRVAGDAGTLPEPGYYGEPDPQAITVSQYGEPLMEPERLLAVLREAREAYGNVRLDLQTNGTLLTPALWERLEGLVDLCMVSVSAADPTHHAAVSGADTFDQLVQALSLVGRSRVWGIVRVVDMPGINSDQLPAITELARRTGMDEVMVHQCAVHADNRDRLVAAGLDLDAVAYVPGLVMRVARAAEETGMRATIQGCVLSTLRTMDADTLPYLVKDSLSEVPRLKRQRAQMGKSACGKDCPGCPMRAGNP